MKKLLLSVPGKILINEPFPIVLKDSVENDLTFRFFMRDDKSKHDSFTRFDIISSTEAEITIYNAPEKKQTSVVEHIPVGSYMRKYNLFVNYILQRESAENGDITVNFYTEEK